MKLLRNLLKRSKEVIDLRKNLQYFDGNTNDNICLQCSDLNTSKERLRSKSNST